MLQLLLSGVSFFWFSKQSRLVKQCRRHNLIVYVYCCARLYCCMAICRLAGLEEDRFQVQILHEYDTCCFSPHARHDKMKAYESNIRAELQAGRDGKHGWFTVAADNHSKHEVCDQDKTLISAALARRLHPADPGWNSLPCDIIHQELPANCAANRDPGLPPGYIPCTTFDNGGSVIPQCRTKEATAAPIQVARYFADGDGSSAP